MSVDPTEDESQGPAEDPEAADSEVTPVGGTSKKLLELSEGGDQNTRAYRAPRELLELARRQRVLGFRPSQPAEARPSAAPPVPVQGLRSEPVPPPPALRASQKPAVSAQKSVSQPAPAAAGPEGNDSSEAASSQKRRVRPISLSPSEFSEGEAAPPRPIAESLGPRDRPTRKPGRSEENVESSGPSLSFQPVSSRSASSVEALQEEAGPGSELVPDAAPPVARSRPCRSLSSEPSSGSPVRPPVSLAELARAASDRSAAPSVPAPSPTSPARELDTAMPSSLSTDMTSARQRAYFWAFVFVLFIVIGFALARWRVLELVLPPAR